MERLIKSLWLLLLFACSQNPLAENEISEENKPRKDDSYEVNTVVAKRETLSYPIQAQGKVEARKFVPIIFETSGILKKVTIGNAQYVNKGQLIAALQNEQHRINVEEARVNYKSKRTDYENRLAAYGDSVNNPTNWPIIQENIALLSGLPAAKLGLERAQLNFDRTKFAAPFSGIIEGFELQEGESVTAMTPIGRVVDTNSLEVTCNVLEFDLGKLGVGDSAAIFPLAYPQQKVWAKVKEINPKVEPNGYVKVRLSIDGRQQLLDGMSARVEIYVPETKQILIPKAAVVKKSGRDVVFTVENALAKWNYVTLGKENGRQVAILEGLESNAEVIISNNLQLAHDSPVRVSAVNLSL